MKRYIPLNDKASKIDYWIKVDTEGIRTELKKIIKSIKENKLPDVKYLNRWIALLFEDMKSFRQERQNVAC